MSGRRVRPRSRSLIRPAAAAAAAVVVAVLLAAPDAGARHLVQLVSPPDVPDCLAQASRPGIDQNLPLNSVPVSRRAVLARGVNMTDLFGPGGKTDLMDDFRRLRRAGVRHVRIPVASQTFAGPPPPWQKDVVARLDNAVCSAVSQGLGVVIDLHSFAAPGPEGDSVEALTARLAGVWRNLAGRYAHASTEFVFFEILNEPKFDDQRQWERMQATLLDAIRSVAPRNTVIATASPWGTAVSLSALTPLADRNVVYTFHLYTPMIFTHQGAAWSLPDYESVRGLGFPATADNVADVSSRAAPERQAELAAYARTFTTDQSIEDEIDLAADWASRQGAALVVTEFGVYAKAAPRSARAAWLAMVRRRLEAHDIGWTVWEYRGGFGVADDLRAGCRVEASAAAALGLCAP